MNERWLQRFKPFIRRGSAFIALLLRPMTLGVRVLVLDDTNRVLLVRHGYLPGWYLPGGGVDSGETLGTAALRELREEAGMIGDTPRLLGVYKNTHASPRDHVALFRVERFRPMAEGWKPGLEIREIGFFALDALPEGTTTSTRNRIAEVFEGAAQSEIW